MPQTFVSIVMPSYNQVEFVGEAISSVLSQDWKNIELIIADGQSSDGSWQVIQEWSRQDSRIHAFSETDEGPADAINKALAKVRGTIIGWLNSDDLYTPGAVRRAVEALQFNTHRMMVYGQGEHIDENGSLIAPYPTKPDSTESSPQVPDKTAFQDGCFICQPTVFFKTVMYRLLGPLDKTVKTAFDFDYWLRAFEVFRERVGFIPEVQARSRFHDGCITRNQRYLVALEGMQALAKHQGQAPCHWLLTFLDEQIDLNASRGASFSSSELTELITLLRKAKDILSQSEWQILHRELLFRLNNPGKARDFFCLDSHQIEIILGVLSE